ncbi:MAG TPA: hypothetical protein VEJ18_07130 [Planctomycetota bacterium]|nr:hypothetical protein [Planctomycetota bacterium]
MLTFLALLALGQDVPPEITVEALQVDDRITLSSVESTPPKRPLRQGHLRLEARSTLPDGTVLKVSATPIRDVLRNGRLEREQTPGVSVVAQVKGGTFISEGDFPLDAVRWELAIEAPEDFQSPPLREQVKAAFAGRRWRFLAFTTNIFQAHSPEKVLDGVLLRLESARRNIMELAFTVASPSEDVWRERKEALEPFLRKSLNGPRLPFLTAAEDARHVVAKVCLGDLGAQVWQGGQVMRVLPPGAPPGPLTVEGLLDHVTEAEHAAGRELLLLALDDARRGPLGPAHAKALSKAHEIPGLESLVDRLKPGADLDAIEKDVRTLKRR